MTDARCEKCLVGRMMAERDAARLITEGYAKMLDAADAKISALERQVNVDRREIESLTAMLAARLAEYEEDKRKTAENYAALERQAARERTDCAILLAQIDAIKDVHSVGPEDEDDALVEQIRADLRLRWMGITQPAPTEYQRKLAQMKEDFPNGI